MRRSAFVNPLKRLVLEIRFAALRIGDENARRIAAREAERIPETLVERHRSKKGDMAKLARALMRRLPQMAAEELLEAEATLRGCAEALESDFRKTDETWLGQRRRHDETHAA